MRTLEKIKTLRLVMLASCCLALAAVGCGDDDSGDDDDSGEEEEGGSGGDGDEGGSGGRGGSGGKGGSGGSTAGSGGSTAGSGGSTAGSGGSTAGSGGSGGGDCDPTDKETEVDGDITKDTTWTCGTYLLQDLIFVTGDSTLTIEPGVQVLGDTDQQGVVTALIITRGSKLIAKGTAGEPIVFSSGNPEGARAPGDWGGVVLLGAATINTGSCKEGSGDACTDGYFETNIEGLDPSDPKALYGGKDDAHSCGELTYARIEFAGFQLSMDNELNGLTVGGCGTGTKLSYVQVHRGSDDGVEFFGGTAGFDHLLLSAISDDGLDWDLGWRGKGQFLIAHMTENDGDKAIEADNLGSNESATPISNPTLYNATLIGNPTKVALLLREGTQGTFRNFILSGFQTAVDLAATMVQLPDLWPSKLSIESSVFLDNGAIGDSDSTDDDMNFNEDEAVKDAARKNAFDIDVEFGDTDITGPDYKPAGDELADKAAPPAGFDTKATYAGAVDPAGSDWTDGWTAFPEN